MIKFLQDDAGNSSSIRLAMLVTIAFVMVGWLFVALTTRTVPDIPSGLLGVIGTVIAGKVWQKYPEAKQ